MYKRSYRIHETINNFISIPDISNVEIEPVSGCRKDTYLHIHLFKSTFINRLATNGWWWLHFWYCHAVVVNGKASILTWAYVCHSCHLLYSKSYRELRRKNLELHEIVWSQADESHWAWATNNLQCCRYSSWHVNFIASIKVNVSLKRNTSSAPVWTVGFVITGVNDFIFWKLPPDSVHFNVRKTLQFILLNWTHGCLICYEFVLFHYIFKCCFYFCL